MKREIVILGGGFAGLAAAVLLSARGHKVILFEKRGHLGGRAYSFRDPATGSVLDNGQHLFMGCYRATTRFLEKIGRLADLHFQRRLSVDFAGPRGQAARFQAWPLPDPLGLLGGLFSFRGFSFWEKLRFLKMRRASGTGSTGGTGSAGGTGGDLETISHWLRRWGQGDRMISRFWNPLALATVNDDPGISSAAIFEPVLREGLFSGRGSRIGVPQVGLSELYAEPAREFVEKNGGHVFLKTPVKKLHFDGGQFREIELPDGRRLYAETLIVAVPFTALKKILPEEMVYQDPFFHPIHRMTAAPIVTINLWFDRDFVDSDFVALWETRVHWLFNKGRILKKGGGPPYYTLVISGAREEMKIPGPELVRRAAEELQTVFPQAGAARLLHSHVMKEPEATLAPSLGIGKLRLSQQTPYPNLYLAGDWTDTGLPATIEGAVRSAVKVVDLIEAEG